MTGGSRQRSETAADAAAPAAMAASPPVHVVAAVLRDARGRILLARRTADRDLAGLWEFPGGKVEAGEAPEQALARELREELGIEIGASSPLIAVPHAYAAPGSASVASTGGAGAAPHKRIVPDVRTVAAFRGRPRGLERQALAWVTPEKLADYAMPAADRPVVAALRQPDRYLITPEPGDDDGAFLASIEHALAAGVTRVQLRARGLDATRARRLAEALRARIAAAGGELLLNSAIAGSQDLARALDCGLHLTATDLAATAAASMRRPAMLAASCHDAAQLQQAQRLGCDFAVLGPVAPTPTHPGAEVLGWTRFAALRETVALPIYALGGLAPTDLDSARAHGAQGIAAIRGLWPATPDAS
jgi:8-oxo-dGTP diphosphatase